MLLIDSGYETSSAFIFPKMWLIIFPFLINKFQGAESVLAGPFLRNDHSSAVMDANVMVPYFNLAFSLGLLIHFS